MSRDSELEPRPLNVEDCTGIPGPAFQAARELVDQRSFEVSGEEARAFLDLLERPAEDCAGLRDLFSRREPWETE